MSGACDIVIAGGVESMTRVPMGSSIQGEPFTPFGHLLISRYGGRLVPQGISAELIAQKWKLSREELDAFSLQSHRRAAIATEEGRFKSQMLPIRALNEDSMSFTLDRDEGIRPDTNMDNLAYLKPAFKQHGLSMAGVLLFLNAQCLVAVSQRVSASDHLRRI